MKSRKMTIPSLMRMAANAAQLCMKDPECTVDFNGIGVEPGQNSRYVVNLPGAVLVKVFGQNRDKRFGTQGEPPWQASLHEIGKGRLGRGLELALQTTAGEVAPASVISKMEEEFRKFDSGIASTQWKIDWVNDCADKIAELTDWEYSDSLIEFKDYAPRVRARLSQTRRPFWKFHEEIAKIVDENRGLDADSGWGTVDYFEVRDVAKRVRLLSEQLSDITSDDISEDEIQMTTAALQRVLIVLRDMKNWDLSDKNAVEARVDNMGLLKQREAELRRAVYEWVPLWTIAQSERRKAEAEQSEQRARQAQAEASGEAINVVAFAYEDQAGRDFWSKVIWTGITFLLIVAIVAVNIWLMNSNNAVSGSVWGPERIDSLITRLLCTSVLGGIAYWAGRIATIKLRHETDNRLKAVIARTVEGMKEGADSDSAKEQIGLMSVARLVGIEHQRQGDETGPMSGDPGPHVREGMEAAVKEAAGKKE